MAGGAEAAALGFRAHTGWAVAVALAGPVASPALVTRRRLELHDPAGAIPRAVYHAVREEDPPEGTGLIGMAEEAAERAAADGIGRLVAELGRDGHRVSGGMVLLGMARLPATLEAILASHILCHAAEGALFREALLGGGRRCGLRVAAVAEPDVWGQVAHAAGLGADEARRRVAALGRAAGPPWDADHKLAAAAAWLALATTTSARR